MVTGGYNNTRSKAVALTIDGTEGSLLSLPADLAQLQQCEVEVLELFRLGRIAGSEVDPNYVTQKFKTFDTGNRKGIAIMIRKKGSKVLVGFALLGEETPRTAEIMLLVSFAKEGRVRFAMQLLYLAKLCARQHGYTHVFAQSTQAVIATYERNGFHDVGELAVSQFDTSKMELTLEDDRTPVPPGMEQYHWTYGTVYLHPV